MSYRREVVTKLLLERGSDIKSKDKDGRIALSLAVQGGYLAVLILLVRKDVDIETIDKQGRILLIYAAARAKSDTILYLVSKGIGTIATNYKRKGLLYYIIVIIDSILNDIRSLILIGVNIDSYNVENIKPLYYTI